MGEEGELELCLSGVIPPLHHISELLPAKVMMLKCDSEQNKHDEVTQHGFWSFHLFSSN